MADLEAELDPYAVNTIFKFEDFVLMPHNPHNVIISLSQRERTKQSRWTVIQQSLLELKESISSSKGDHENVINSIRTCIETYNPNIECNFSILKDLFSYESSVINWKTEDVLISIIDAALEIWNLFPHPDISVELLRKGENRILRMTCNQVHCVLANAFLCTFPKREAHHKKNYQNYPRINFTQLFDDSSNVGTSSWQRHASPAKLHKLICFMNYFFRMGQLSFEENPIIIYEKKTLSSQDIVEWGNSNHSFSKLTVVQSQSEENSTNRLKVDFANKFVGGGTLGNGSAMEEILFATCPELVAAQLFTECLGDTDVLLVHGFAQYSNYVGYGSSFEFNGDVSNDHREHNHIVAMDALRFSRVDLAKQFTPKNVNRELNKCFCAFNAPTNSGIPSREIIVSGKWGCGIFNGHPVLKCCIQWMAASVCNVPLELNTFGDAHFENEMNILADAVYKDDCNVGKLYKLILEYGRNIRKVNINDLGLAEFLQRKLSKPQIMSDGESSLVPEISESSATSLDTTESEPIQQQNNLIQPIPNLVQSSKDANEDVLETAENEERTLVGKDDNTKSIFASGKEKPTSTPKSFFNIFSFRYWMTKICSFAASPFRWVFNFGKIKEQHCTNVAKTENISETSSIEESTRPYLLQLPSNVAIFALSIRYFIANWLSPPVSSPSKPEYSSDEDDQDQAL